MSKYRLKDDQDEFQVMDGPMAGTSFVPGVKYDEVPAAFKDRFKKTPKPKQAPKAKATKAIDAGGTKK